MSSVSASTLWSSGRTHRPHRVTGQSGHRRGPDCHRTRTHRGHFGSNSGYLPPTRRSTVSTRPLSGGTSSGRCTSATPRHRAARGSSGSGPCGCGRSVASSCESGRVHTTTSCATSGGSWGVERHESNSCRPASRRAYGSQNKLWTGGLSTSGRQGGSSSKTHAWSKTCTSCLAWGRGSLSNSGTPPTRTCSTRFSFTSVAASNSTTCSSYGGWASKSGSTRCGSCCTRNKVANVPSPRCSTFRGSSRRSCASYAYSVRCTGKELRCTTAPTYSSLGTNDFRCALGRGRSYGRTGSLTGVSTGSSTCSRCAFCSFGVPGRGGFAARLKQTTSTERYYSRALNLNPDLAGASAVCVTRSAAPTRPSCRQYRLLLTLALRRAVAVQAALGRSWVRLPKGAIVV